MEKIQNFLKPEIFFNNTIVIVILSLLILVIILKILDIILNFLSQKITSKLNDKKHGKQINTVFMMLKSCLNIIITLIFAMGILSKLGIDIRPILTAAGVLGVAIGFGSKRFVEDVISGIMLILEGQIRVGDIIEIGNRMGTVEKINLQMVLLRDVEGKVHYIRNGMIDIVTNYTRDYAYATVEIGIAYKENVDKVMQVIIDIAQNELKNGQYGKCLLADIEMFGITNFGDSSVNLKFRIKTTPQDQWNVAREFNRLIKNKFDQLNIEIPFPQRTIHIEKAE